MIIDCHQHLEAKPDYAERLREASLAAGVVRTVIFSAPDYYGMQDNRAHLKAAERYPDFYIPFYYFRLGEEQPAILKEVVRDGFRGLKFICPTADYDDAAFLPVYAQAEELALVCLFHLGIVARPQGVVVREGFSRRMRPIMLDTIARCCPGLKLIGAHSGNPWLDEMAMAVRWNDNLYADLSGSMLKHRRPGYLNELYWWDQADPFFKGGGAGPYDKIVFGSDDAPAKVAVAVQDHQRHFDGINLPREKREKVWHRNAASLLGLPL